MGGVSPFSWDLMGPVACLSRCRRRGTEAGPSAPLVSPSSSLECPVAAPRAPQKGEAHQSQKARNLKEREGVEVLPDAPSRSSTLDEIDRQPGLFTNDLQNLLLVLKREKKKKLRFEKQIQSRR